MQDKANRDGRAEAACARGIELAERGWLDQALVEFEHSIALDPHRADPLLHHAGVLVDQGRLFEALDDLLAARRLAPGDAVVHHQLGSFLTRYALDLGKGELERALAIEPDHLDALLQLGAVQADAGEWTEAKSALDAVLRLDPNDPWAHHELGVLWLDRGEVHRALEHLRLANEAAPQALEIQVDLGLAYLQAGFVDQARIILSRVADCEPNHLIAQYNLAAICAAREDCAGAIDHLERAAAVSRQLVGDWLRDDPHFDVLRREERFRSWALTAGLPDVG